MIRVELIVGEGVRAGSARGVVEDLGIVGIFSL